MTGTVLANDRDPLTARLTRPPARGTVDLAADGTFTYTHGGAGNKTKDTFKYVAGDGELPAVFRPSNTTFYMRYTNTQGIADSQIIVGLPHFLPVGGELGLGPQE